MNYDYRRKNFSKNLDLSIGNTSKLWSEFRKDFRNSNSNLRGYGLSRIGEKKRKLYVNLIKFYDFTISKVPNFGKIFRNYYIKILSFLIFNRDSQAGSKYGFSDYNFKIYDKSYFNEFLNKYQKYGIGFSHNSFKSFVYLSLLKSNLSLSKNLKIFEIGAGVFNFGHLMSYDLEKFEYVMCDLPEMILKCHQEITETYIPKCDGNYEVFLPNEQKEFKESSYERKVLFITPDQLYNDDLGDQRIFDLFINHESFSEMRIEEVNKYLSYVSKLMKKNAIINLVNRHSRIQALTYQDFCNLNLKEITSFDDYDLSFCKVLKKEIDIFRSRIGGQQSLPNIFYLGEVN